MSQSVFTKIDATLLCLLLFAGCLLMVTLGRRIRKRFLRNDDEESKGGVNALLGALFGLWGFILAFCFSNSWGKFENIRDLMVDEANIIRNVLLRTQTLPDSTQSIFKMDLKKYLEARIDYYESEGDSAKFNKS